MKQIVCYSADEKVVLTDTKIIKSWTSRLSLLNIKSHCFNNLTLKSLCYMLI